MTSVKVAIGPIILEVISDDIETDLRLAVQAAKELMVVAPKSPAMTAESSAAATNRNSQTPDATFDHGINTYVAKFGGDSGRRILRAASFHLSLVDGLESFSKDSLIARAREAREWKKDYVNTQATDLRRMVTSGDLIERSNGMFTVPTKALEEGKALLSQ
ncbi:hypothetical protein [Brevundimonas sp.]|uniref:hypothetical protein n=1 Tax=Brevundimonas sp. TaxID=1871086 RepID=UPI002FC97F6C